MASVVVGAWLPINIDIIANQIFPRDIDVWIGVLTMLVVLEGARRAVGLGMTIIGAVFIAYAFAGSRGASCPSRRLENCHGLILPSAAIRWSGLASQSYAGRGGEICGQLLSLGWSSRQVLSSSSSSSFGAFLEVTGAGKVLHRLSAYAVDGAASAAGPPGTRLIASAGMVL